MVTATATVRNSAGVTATQTAVVDTTSSGAWPSGWDDPRYANNVTGSPQFNTGSTIVTWQNLTVIDNGGNPCFGYGNYKLLNVRYRGREGPRISGSNITIDGCYIEVSGSGADHADGIQGYAGSGPQQNLKNIIIRNTKVILTGGALNCGIFISDFCGADLILENVYVDGDGAPNGAIWLPCGSSDLGCKSLIARNVMVKSATTGTFANRFFRLDPTPSLCNIIEWTNVRRWDGIAIPKPV